MEALAMTRKPKIVAVVDQLVDAESEASIDAQAANDERPDERPSEPTVPLISAADALVELNRTSTLPVYPSGLPSLDAALGFGGFQAQTLNYLTSGPGVGKTTKATWMATRVAERFPVVYATNEMTPAMLLAKIAAAHYGVSVNQVFRREVLTDAEVIASVPANFVWLYRPTFVSLRRAIQQTSDKHGVAPFVVVDYVNPMVDVAAPDARLAMTAASGHLRDIAVETSSPFLAIAAASRNGNQRASSARKLAPAALIDVARESGAVEFDATSVLVASSESETDDDGWDVCTLTVAKSRWGRTGHLDVRYHGATARWRDCGPIERTAVSSAKRDTMREEILASLAKHDRPVSFRVLVGKGEGRERAVRGRDGDIKAEAEAMRKEGLIEIVGGFYRAVQS
jgi:replicative DNA helicase